MNEFFNRTLLSALDQPARDSLQKIYNRKKYELGDKEIVKYMDDLLKTTKNISENDNSLYITLEHLLEAKEHLIEEDVTSKIEEHKTVDKVWDFKEQTKNKEE